MTAINRVVGSLSSALGPYRRARPGFVRTVDDHARRRLEETNPVECGDQPDLVAGRQLKAVLRDGADFLRADIGIDVNFGACRFDDGNLGGETLAPAPGRRCSGRMPYFTIWPGGDVRIRRQAVA